MNESNWFTFEDRKPWQRRTSWGEAVSCNVPTSFSPCLLRIDSFCCVTVQFISIVAISKEILWLRERKRNQKLYKQDTTLFCIKYLHEMTQSLNKFWKILTGVNAQHSNMLCYKYTTWLVLIYMTLSWSLSNPNQWWHSNSYVLLK